MVVIILRGKPREVCDQLKAMLNRYGNVTIKEMLIGRE